MHEGVLKVSNRGGLTLPRYLILTYLTHTDGVVRQDVADGELRQRSNTHGRTHVVREHKEGSAGAPVKTEVRDSIQDRAHSVLADAIVEVATGVAAVFVQSYIFKLSPIEATVVLIRV